MCRSEVAPAAAGPLAAILGQIAAVLADRDGVDPSQVRIGPVDFGGEDEESMTEIEDKLTEDLTAEDQQVLADNHAQASAALDELVAARIEHRAAGCTHWYCTDQRHVDLLGAYSYHQMHQVLAIAVDRLAVVQEEIRRNNLGAA